MKAFDWRSNKPGSNGSSNAAIKVNLIDCSGGDSLMRKLIIDATQPSLKADVDLSQGQELVFNMSSIINLTDLVEDEIIPVPFPFQVGWHLILSLFIFTFLIRLKTYKSASLYCL